MDVPLDFENNNYVEYVQQLALHFKTKLTGNLFHLPQIHGKGFMWAETLPGGISVLVMNVLANQTFSFSQQPLAPTSYCLQFNEYSTNARRNKTIEELPSAIRLSSTQKPDTYTLPEGVHLRSVCFYFNQKQLSNMLGKQAVNELVSNHFPRIIDNGKTETITTNYRVLLNELQVEKIDVPLRLNFIQNRILLLLENFILNLYEGQKVSVVKAKRTDDERQRLIKVEALLVNNFAVAPPTIEELSRISAMSPTKLKNDFKHQYGDPIYVYYQKNRMQRARTLLNTGKYSIKEVGVMVGYSNLSHFASTFKKEFNILPSELNAKDGVLVYNT